MKITIVRLFAATAALALGASAAAAQQTMTVSGHVTSRSAPVVGAHVRVPSLKIDRTTDVEGRYSFVIPSASVRGQGVTLTASMEDRRVRYSPKSVVITLSGGSITQDFDLQPVGEAAITAQSDEATAGGGGAPAPGSVEDTLHLYEFAGAVSFPSALAGRVPGLSVMTSTVLGGSSTLEYRGAHSLLGSSQPLYVVDGIPMDNTTFASTAQRYGLGGFDYGSPIQDVDPANIESIRFVSGAEATARYGGRAASGVIVVTTKPGSGGAIAISAAQQITSEKIGTLPTFQNSYGQGLNGKFEFFNGRGGGVNDNVDQSWGPALDGRPLAQASYTEAGRGDVRLFAARPGNVSSFFRAGRTLTTSFDVQGSGDAGSYRFFGSNRDTRGLVLAGSLVRQEAGAHLAYRPSQQLTLELTTTIAETKNAGAAGTGYNQGNAYSQFTRLGRQVDLDSLHVHLRDAAGNQISWNYSGQNNPFVAELLNTNRSLRDHGFGAATATYAISPEVKFTARGGADYFRDGRLFTIAPGWMGGYPFLTGAGDYSKGGSEGDYVSVQQKNFSARLDNQRTVNKNLRWTIGIGVDYQTTHDETRSAGVDSAANVPSAGAPTGSTVPAPATWINDASTTGVFGETSLAFAQSAVIRAGLRGEGASYVSGQSSTTIYPAISGTYDLKHAVGSLRDSKSVSAATLRAGLSRTGTGVTPYAVETMYSGRLLSSAVTPIAAASLAIGNDLKPEVTTNAQLGADVSFAARRVSLGFTAYSARTTDVILPVENSTRTGARAVNAGEISNSGIELDGALRLGDGDRGFGWELSGNIAKNNNRVEKLNDTVTAIALGPTLFGTTIEARTGSPLGVITGRPYLRDASGALLLTAGLPVPNLDPKAQLHAVSAPNWIVGMRAAARYRWLSFEMLADGHIGGNVFSSTKLWGDFAGNLAETGFRPDSGLLIQGIDAVTKRANTQHVSTQDYYHSLGAIQEPWLYSASYLKLRDTRVTLLLPTTVLHLPFQSMSFSLIGRNLHTWSTSGDFDPEAVLSPYRFTGFELGQYPATRSIGLQLTLVP